MISQCWECWVCVHMSLIQNKCRQWQQEVIRWDVSIVEILERCRSDNNPWNIVVPGGEADAWWVKGIKVGGDERPKEQQE